MHLMKKSVLSLKKQKQYKIRFPFFKLHVLKSYMTDPLNIIFNDLGI